MHFKHIQMVNTYRAFVYIDLKENCSRILVGKLFNYRSNPGAWSAPTNYEKKNIYQIMSMLQQNLAQPGGIV